MVKGTWIETRVVSLHSHEAYRAIYNFIKTARIEGVKVNLEEGREPSYLRAKVSYSTLEVTIHPHDGQSLLRFSFNIEHHLHYWIYAWLLFIVMDLLAWSYPVNIMFLPVTIVLAVAFIISMKSHTENVKNKFMNELDAQLIHKEAKKESE